MYKCEVTFIQIITNRSERKKKILIVPKLRLERLCIFENGTQQNLFLKDPINLSFFNLSLIIYIHTFKIKNTIVNKLSTVSSSPSPILFDCESTVQPLEIYHYPITTIPFSTTLTILLSTTPLHFFTHILTLSQLQISNNIFYPSLK